MNEYELMIYELCNIETNMNIYCCKKKKKLYCLSLIKFNKNIICEQ